MRTMMMLLCLLVGSAVYAGQLATYTITTPYLPSDVQHWRCPTSMLYQSWYTQPPDAPWWYESWNWTTLEGPDRRKEYHIGGAMLPTCRVNRAWKRWECFRQACLSQRSFASCNTDPYRYPPPNCG